MGFEINHKIKEKKRKKRLKVRRPDVLLSQSAYQVILMYKQSGYLYFYRLLTTNQMSVTLETHDFKGYENIKMPATIKL